MLNTCETRTIIDAEIVSNPRMDILEQFKAGKISTADAMVALAKLSPTEKTAGKLTFKVSEKGAVSVYGLQRFPCTFYSEQWERLLAQSDAIKAFIAENKAHLKTKAQSDAEKAAKKS